MDSKLYIHRAENEIKLGEIIKEVKWLEIEGIKKGKYKVGPNLLFLANKIKPF